MILIAWLIYFFLSLIISSLFRKLFKRRLLKVITFSLVFSFLSSLWFTFPTSQDLAPISSIFLIGLIETENFMAMRIIRPFILLFIVTLIIDFFLSRRKSKN